MEENVLAPRWNPQLKAVYEREAARSSRNQATLAVARKLVAYLLFVDKTQKPFTPREDPAGEEGARRGEKSDESNRWDQLGGLDRLDG